MQALIPKPSPLTTEHGASVWKMMDVSRRKSVDTMRGYVRDAESFNDHAAAAFL
jgi:hypothetical protein